MADTTVETPVVQEEQNVTVPEKAKKAPTGNFFYFLLCLCAFLLILLPVGIANLYFGYILGDSPCTLCWGQRIAMIYIALSAFFIVRYGFKPRYLASLLIFTGFGLWQSFRHVSMHAGRDLDQGFGLMVYGLHTYFWAEIVFWAVIVLLGVMFFFAPKGIGPAEVQKNGKRFRKLTGFGKFCFLVSFLIIASNCMQAAISTGFPPNYGQGDPIRFSFSPEKIIHVPYDIKKEFKPIGFLGKRDVKSPDFAFAHNGANLGIKFNQVAHEGPLYVNQELEIVSERKIEIKQPLNTLAFIHGEYVVSSKNRVFFLNTELDVIDSFEIDPLFSATIDPIVGITPWKDNKYILMGANKTYMKFEKSVTDHANAQLIGRYSDFVKGGNHFLASGRGRVETVRAKYNHIMSSTQDRTYNYMATVPNNRDKKTFVISKQLLTDMVTSGEFTPTSPSLLKKDRSLGELYITGMSVYDGKLYALSKNYNVILEIDPQSEQILRVFSVPANLKDVRGLIAGNESFQLLNNNTLITLN